ncbi:histidinol-phosphate transaminase [Ferrimonas balearica]|uniref:histidinol-phosphate transaminase n=1 Tax=Ferrimonas balearica TaxID=44012 RepID=UPI001C99967D|nr:histidinol-phosphate transaminase [Ferrimonas balearica]MBY5920603.1 histidinol-phosphate transaminase [Ferrimonas balearica]MBY5996712.1 histidinol-phosphate transaminase [Ferrimonas balearica]
MSNSEQRFNRLVRPEIAALTPYASARREASGGTVWLNANESPWNNSTVVGVNRYPDCQPGTVRSAYAGYAGVSPEQVLITRGADEGIDLLIRAFCRPGIDSVATCGPSYGMYAISAATNAVACRTLNWAEGYQLPEDFATQVQGCKLVFVCNPNNPSGTVIAPETLVALAAQLPDSLLVVDEAYIEFCPELTVSAAIAKCENLVVLRTLSKAFALAGARCGFTLANPAVIAILEKVIAPYPVPEPVAQLAAEALSPEGLKRMQTQVAQLNARRERLAQRLGELPGVRQVLPSRANFLLFELSEARYCYEQLARQGLFIRAYRNPSLDDWLRISIGANSEIEQVEQALNAALDTAPVINKDLV